MRALANDREITATLGVPVRRVEAAAWFGSGLVCGAAGLLLADLLTSLDYSALTFLVISSLAAALIGRLRSLWVTLFGGLAVGLRAVRAHPVQLASTPYRSRRRSCSRSSRSSSSPGTASSRSRGRRAELVSWLATGSRRGCQRCRAGRVDRGILVRAAIIAVLLARRDLRGAAFVGADWITTFTSVAIYSVVALGFGILYGRVGMISLGQIALLDARLPGSARGSPTRRRLPFPLLLLVAGLITCAIGVARRPAGAAALRPLPRADHADVRRRGHRSCSAATDFPNGGRGFKGRSRRSTLSRARPRCAGRRGRSATSRTTATPSSSARSCSCSRCSTSRASPGAPGRRSARASRQRSPPASTSRSTSSGRSRSRRS